MHEGGAVATAEEAGGGAPPAPWLQRFAERAGFGPVRLGVAIVVGLCALFAVAELAQGRHRLLSGLPAEGLRDTRLALVHFLLLGYAPAAFLGVVYGSRRRIEAVRPLLAPGDAAAAALADGAGSYPRAELRAAGLLGVAGAILLPLLAEGGRDVYRPSIWDPEVVWHRMVAPFLGWWTGRFFYALLTESGRFSQLAARLPALDLLDLRPLAVFVRQGLAHALLIAGFVAVFALFLFESGFGTMLVVLGVANLAVSAAGLLLPLSGARQRIRAAKRTELADLRPRLARAREELRSAAGADGRVADLLAYRAFVEGVREWPLDASNVARFALYLLIPLGSWLGGSLVDQLVDRIFD